MRRFFIVCWLFTIAIMLTQTEARAYQDSTAPTPAIAEIEEIAADAYGGEEPGASVLVMQGDTVLIANGFGIADLEWGSPITEDTSFRIGSISKPFTAVAILQMVDAGLIDLDQPISAYLSDLPENLGRPTIRQLLSHTSGLPDHFSLPVIPSIMRNPITPDGIIALMTDAQLNFEPGTRWAYSNFNYVLLGKLIEALDEQGRDFGTYVEEEIFLPLAMENSHYDRQSAVVPSRARGYDHDGSRAANTITVETSLAYAAGALMSSANDMALFTNALRDGTLMSEEMQEIAWTAIMLPDGQSTGYGLGFNVSEFLGETAIWHNGSINGFQAAWIYLPASDRTVAVLSNGYYRPNTTVMARRILAVLADQPVPLFTPVESDDTMLSGFVGRYQLDDNRILQIHVQNGARFNIDGGNWNELTFSGGNLFYISDSLTHLRFRPDAADDSTALTYVSSTLIQHQGRQIPGDIEGAAIAIPLDPEESDALTGNWLMSSGDAFSVTREGEGLRFQMPNQPPETLYRKGLRQYFVRTAPVELTLSDNGQELELNLYGNTLLLAKE